jgi:hypothetical protein
MPASYGRPFAIVAKVRTAMSYSHPLSYSAALAQKPPSSQQTYGRFSQTNQPEPSTRSDRRSEYEPLKKSSPSPSHLPQTDSVEGSVYVLTLLTDHDHHDRMTTLRIKYFPKHLNKLDAHLTLFHALPGSKLESSILPLLEDVATRTSPFRVRADVPFRLKKGFAVGIADGEGGVQGRRLRGVIQGAWKKEGWLSTQDTGGCRLHYTLMNKVDDSGVVEAAYGELLEHFKGDAGMVEGLTLWRYDRGFWKWDRKFAFKGT